MLVKLYGRKALVFHDSKSDYRVESGVLMVPPHLVQRAIDAGFSLSPIVDEDVTAAALAPVSEPATEVHAPPEHHPQTAVDTEQRQPAVEKTGGKRK